MTDMPIQIQHDDYIYNGVLVKGGTNWDASATVQESPIQRAAPLPTNVIVESQPKLLPTQKPVLAIAVGKKYRPLTKIEAAKLCKGLTPHAYVVAAGKSPLAEKLATNVAKSLTSCGTGFAARVGMVPFAPTPAGSVEIFFQL